MLAKNCAPRKAGREDEQRERNVLQVGRDARARLAEQQRHDQRAAHAAQLDGSDLERANQVSGRKTREQRNLRRRLKQFGNHVRISRKADRCMNLFKKIRRAIIRARLNRD
jgi:hypothetical protein